MVFALSGGRASVEFMYWDFLGLAGDEVFNQMSKWQAMSGGELTMPLVLRVSVGSKYGAQHSQDWSSLLAHIPGFQVRFPATPYHAKAMLGLALRGIDPVELGQPALRRTGRDVTIVTIGAVLFRALEAAEELLDRARLGVRFPPLCWYWQRGLRSPRIGIRSRCLIRGLDGFSATLENAKPWRHRPDKVCGG